MFLCSPVLVVGIPLKLKTCESILLVEEMTNFQEMDLLYPTELLTVKKDRILCKVETVHRWIQLFNEVMITYRKKEKSQSSSRTVEAFGSKTSCKQV